MDTIRQRRERLALAGLLVTTAALYIWGLSASGWANPFYSAAVQAGSESWKAFFFGSSDAANAITVDKTPAALWPMALSVRAFGLDAWSILVPQALMGVATVATVYATVRRLFPAWSALLAGAVMALTPVAVLMFRFNNPDALLVLLLSLAAYCVARAQERASTRWLVLAGVCVGFGFLAKMMQAFVVLPGFALVYLVTAPAPLGRRLWQLVLAGGAMAAAAGWWLVAVALVPESERPYIGGSQGNSVLELALGYNGIGRLNGDDYGGLGSLNEQAGWLRLFDTEAGGQIAWLLPAALILLAAGIWTRRSAARTDAARAAFALWGSWLVVTGLIFSLMQGIFHAYYTVALAPAIAALVGMGTAVLWSHRRSLWAAGTLAAAVAVTAVWSWVLLSRSSEWNAWLGPAVLVTGVAAAIALVAATRWGGGSVAAVRRLPGTPAEIGSGVRTHGTSAGIDAVEQPRAEGDAGRGRGASAGIGAVEQPRAEPAPALVRETSAGIGAVERTRAEGDAGRGRGASAGVGAAERSRAEGAAEWVRGRGVEVAAVVAVVACLAGPAAYAVDTAGSAHAGAIPTAGPSTRGFGGGPGGPDGGPGGRMSASRGSSNAGPSAQDGGQVDGRADPQDGGQVDGRTDRQDVGQVDGRTGPQDGGQVDLRVDPQVDGRDGGVVDSRGTFARGLTGGRGGGGLLNAAAPSAEVIALLKADAAPYTWVAATVGSNNAAGFQLATELPVMAVGGFNGTDPAPTLADFQRYAKEGKIHYFVGGGMGMGRRTGATTGGSDDAARIAAWVQENFTARTVGGVTLYDLTAG